jgi:transposase
LVLSYRGIRRYQGKGGRAEMQFDASRGRWYFRYSVQVLDTPSKPWTRVAGIDLGLRVMASLSIEGIANAWHFLGREAMKDFEYWSAKLATHQQALSHRGKRTSKRLKRFYRMRKNRLRHAVDTMAKRLASACRRHKVGHVLLGWPKGILLETRANPTWQRLRHVFWSFDYVSSRVELALRRVGIRVERVGERGTSSTFCTCGSKRVVRRPRHVLRCQDCQFKCHSDQAGSRNIVRQRYPETTWAGLEASPKPKTYRWTRHRWVDASNPAIYQVADLAA